MTGSLKKLHTKDGEKAQQLKAHTAPAGDLCLVPSTHNRQLTTNQL